MLKPLLRFDLKGSKKWLMDAELVGLSEKDKNAILSKKNQWKICAILDSVYARTVLFNCFNTVGSPFRQTWLCKNL